MKRTPLKRSQKPLKRSPLKRTSFKKKSNPDQLKDDHAFYKKIWNERLHVCYETGESLGAEAKTYMFHHVLEKSKYPEYRHAEWNIVLVSWQTHDQVHLNIDKTPKIKKLREQLLKIVSTIPIKFTKK